MNPQNIWLDNPLVGKQALLKHQEILGYNPGTEFWIKVDDNKPHQCIVTSDGFEAYPMRKTGEVDPKGGQRWERRSEKPIANGYEVMRNWSERGGEIFYIPTQTRGGIGKGHVSDLSLCFFETDDRTIAEQRQLIDEFAIRYGIVLSLVIYSGGKSFHPYLKLSESCTPEQWQRLQRKLIILYGSDPQIQNLNREMRLGGFFRKSKGNEQSVVAVSDRVYAPDELEALLDSTGLFPHSLSEERWKKWRSAYWHPNQAKRDRELAARLLQIAEAELNPPRTQREPIPQHQRDTIRINASNFASTGNGINLKDCLSPHHQELIVNGVSQGGAGRQPEGFKLACQAIAIGDFLNREGVAFSGDAYQILREYATRCNPPLGEYEVEHTWKQAQINSGSTKINQDAVLSRVAWKLGASTGHDKTITREQWLSKHGISKDFTKFSDWIKQQCLKPKFGFLQRSGELQKAPQPKPENIQRDDSHIIYYQPGKRLEAWKQAREQGKKYILDASGTGNGKSYTAGEIKPEDFGVSRVIYQTNDPRNVTTPTLKEWDLLEARHDGIVIDPNNDQKRRRKGWKDDRELLTPPNCARPKTIAALREAGIPGADTSEKICRTCPRFDGCRAGVIQFDYLKTRAKVLGGSTNIIAHPNSLLPIDSEFPYAAVSDGDKPDLGTMHVIDEAEETIKITKDLSVNIKDVKDVQATLIDAQSWPVNEGIEYNFDPLYPRLAKLSRIISGEIKAPSYYGWNHHDLIEYLGQFPEEFDLEAILEAIRYLLNEDNLINQILDPYEQEYGVSLEDLPRGVKRSLTEHDSVMAEKVAKLIKQQWLIAFLEIWQGARNGYLSINHGSFNISIPDRKRIDIINGSECNLFLSATLNRERLALMLGCEPDDIAVLKQIEDEGAELEIIQIPDLGRLSKQRGNRQKDAAAAIISKLRSQEPNSKVIDFKKFCDSPDDMAWHRDSRGSNAAKDCNQLIINGTPVINLTALAGEFTALYGRQPLPGTEKVTRFIKTVDGAVEVTSNESVDLEFREFVRSDTLNNFTQAIGRLRANRRPGEKLKVYILSNFAHDFPVQIARAVDIAVSAGSPIEQLSHFVQNTGLTVLRDVAANLGKAASTISQLVKRKLGIGWEEFINNLCCSHLLLEPINSKCEQPPPLDQLEAETSIAEAFELVEADDLIPELIDLVKVWGWDSWQRIVNQLTPAVKTKFIEQLALLLPDDLRELIATG